MTVSTPATDIPAIAGGEPLYTGPFPRERRYGEAELVELKEAIEQNTLFYAQGNKVKQFEKQFAEKHGFRYAISTSSGTASIHTAMMAAGISPGDEVIVTPITDMGSIIPIMFQGGIPVFADLDPHTYELSPAAVEAAVTPKTRAILAVHLWGNSCDLDALSDICKRHNLILIEDCAQSFGCTYKGRPVGGFGAIGCFSYNEFKHVSCGDGGIVVTADEKLARRLRLATDKCYDRDPGAVSRNPTFLGANYRMTELQGAVARAQLAKLDSIVQRRRSWCMRLAVGLKDLQGISLPQPTPGADPSWWFYMMRVKPQELGADADRFAEALRTEGLPVGAHYIGRCIYEYPLFVQHSAFERGQHPYATHDYTKDSCPIAQEILDTAVMLSVNEAYTDKELEVAIRAISRNVDWFRSQK